MKLTLPFLILALTGCVASTGGSDSYLELVEGQPVACGAGFGDCGDGEFCLYKPQNECGQEGPGNCVPSHKVNSSDDGEFSETVCTTSDPVCGCDNNTYANGCVAADAGVDGITLGECGGDDGDTCDYEDDNVDESDLVCPRGGPVGDIAVDFDCTCINVVSCKDLSNVVLELADGSHFKFDGLNGTADTFCNDQEVVGAWVKAGNNKSNDGPGYGEYFEGGNSCCEDASETLN